MYICICIYTYTYTEILQYVSMCTYYVFVGVLDHLTMCPFFAYLSVFVHVCMFVFMFIFMSVFILFVFRSTLIVSYVCMRAYSSLRTLIVRAILCSHSCGIYVYLSTYPSHVGPTLAASTFPSMERNSRLNYQY